MSIGLYKGASLVYVRKALRDAHLDTQVFEALTPADRAMFERLVATDWVPVELADAVYSIAAPLLYPGEPSPTRRLGRDIARDHLGGIYRFIVRLATVSFVVQQTARLWRMYNSEGQLRVEHVEANQLEVVLEDYPRYPPTVRETLAGYIIGAIEYTGASNVRVVALPGELGRWAFRVTWR